METPIRSAAVPAELERAARQALGAEELSASTLIRTALARAAGLDVQDFNGRGAKRWRVDRT